MRLKAIDAAGKFVYDRFPHSFTALLAGSASRGEETDTSDLDVVIFDSTIRDCFRQSFVLYGWRIEAFIHDEKSYIEQMDIDRQTGRATLATMISTGMVIKDNGTARNLKKRANTVIQEGPPPLTSDFIQASRYFMYDLLDDFKDAASHEESLMSINTISTQLADFILRLNGQWSGRGKGLSRAFRQYDSKLCEGFFCALDMYYKQGNKEPLIDFVDQIYEPLGGQLFDGFRQINSRRVGSN